MKNIQLSSETDLHHPPELIALKNLPDLRAHSGETWVHSNDLIDHGRIGHGSGHLLEHLWIIKHPRHLRKYQNDEWINEKDEKKAYHVGVVGVHAEISKRVDARHSSETKVTVELGKGIVDILAGLHCGYLWSRRCRC